ncbi:MAG: imelysin family protein [Planctomycetota bacterium]
MTRSAALVAGLAPGLLVLSGCGGGHGALDGAKTDYAQSFGDTTLTPTFTDVRNEGRALDDTLDVLEAAVDASTLGSAQAQWRVAHTEWSRSEALLFDRLDDLFFIFQVDEVDVDTAAVEAVIAGATTIDVDLILNSGTQLKGFHVLEYLLFSDDLGGATPLAALQASPRRVAYAASVAEELELRLDEVLTVAQSLGLEASVATTREARLLVDQVVNQVILRAEQIADQGLGRPLGMTSGGEPQEVGVESPWAEHSIQDMEAELAGIRLLWRGADGDSGLASMMRLREPESIERVESSVRGLEYALALLEGPLLTAAENDRPTVLDAFDSAKNLAQTFRVVLPRGLLVTGFASPFDGD